MASGRSSRNETKRSGFREAALATAADHQNVGFDFIEDEVALQGVGNLLIAGWGVRRFGYEVPYGLNGFRNRAAAWFFVFHVMLPFGIWSAGSGRLMSGRGRIASPADRVHLYRLS